MAIIPGVGASSMHGAVVPIGYVNITNNTTTSVTFSNIPQIYQDLMLVNSVRQYASTGSASYTQINGTAYTHHSTELLGNGTSAISGPQGGTDGYLQTGVAAPSTASANIYGVNTIHFLNYTNTTTYKTYIGKGAADQNGSGGVALRCGVGLVTSAITSLVCVTDGITALASGSTYALYGVRTVNQ